MGKLNPDFWEVTLSEESWQQLATTDHLYYQDPEEAQERDYRAAQAEAVWPDVRLVMDQVLTPRQREAVYLYFFEGNRPGGSGETSLAAFVSGVRE